MGPFDLSKLPHLLQQIAVAAPPVLFAITTHEVAHGFVANMLGDSTAKDAGRLTLNPLKHLDPIGLLVFVVTRIIGWAKPVPINPFNLRNPKRDMMIVAAAGPFTNAVLAVLSAFLFKAVVHIDPRVIPLIGGFIRGMSLPSLKGTYLMITFPLALILGMSVMINVALCLFNLIPVPPLAGGRIVTGLLPKNLAYYYAKVEPFGIVVVVLLLLSDTFNQVFSHAIWKVVFSLIS